MTPYKIIIYETPAGKSPFSKWLNDLDIEIRARIQLRLDRIEMGNLGKSEPLRGGLYELKINIGPGYRIYFGKIKGHIILLLCAGDKKSQQKDILRAREYLAEHEEYSIFRTKTK